MKRSFGILFCAAAMFYQSVSWSQNNSAFFFLNSSVSRLRVVDGVTYNPSANPAAYKISGTAVSIESWIYPVQLLSNIDGETILKRPTTLGSNDRTDAYALFISFANGYPQAAFSISGGTPGPVVFDPDTLKPFQWTHVAGTYDGSMLKIYINGQLKAQTPSAISITGTAIGLYLGRSSLDGFFGLIDDVRLWNAARTATDINTNKDIILTGTETGLAGNWLLDTAIVNGTGSLVAPDHSPNANDLSNYPDVTYLAFNPFSPSSPTSISITPSSFTLGTGIEQGTTVTQAIAITNSSSSPLFGFFRTASPNISVTSSSVYYIPPMTTQNTSVSVQPIVAGTSTGTITFTSNATTTVDFPFTVSCYPLQFFDVNTMRMWVSRNGRFANNQITSWAGLEWPKGSGHTVVYSSGIEIGAVVGGQVHVATAEYASEFRAGPLTSPASDPSAQQYRVYKINRGDTPSNPDYAEWPADLGAPVNSDGTPAIIGDQTLFSIYNDQNATSRRFGTLPLGAEVQQTTFGFNQTGALANTVFLRFKIINKSSDTWQNTYVALWSDPDLGNFADDLVGIDTTRTLGFTYNATPVDTGYGSTPPAVGYDILKGAFFTKEIQAFARYASGVGPPNNDPSSGVQVYNFLQGLRSDGSPFVDPVSGLPTKFPYSGDPVTGTGWVDSAGNDRRFLFSTGPFDLEPGQSKELIAAIIVGQGTDNINSITALRAASDEIQTLFDNGQVFGGRLENVTSASVTEGDTSTLNDLANSGAQLGLVGGTGGATVEAGSYVGPPPGAAAITTPTVTGVGKYVDVQVQGDIAWPVDIRIYYTANDLSQAGVTEGDLVGIYYWNGTTSQWILYSNSGADDQGRGTSTTGVNTTNIVINSVTYEGYVYASAYHLTPIIIGSRKASIASRYAEAINFIKTLPDNAFLKPGKVRKFLLIESLKLSQWFYGRARKIASGILTQEVLTLVTGHYPWIVDVAARAKFVQMVQDLVGALGPPASKYELRAAVPAQELIAETVPRELTLSNAYPNPFNPQTQLQFTLPDDGRATVRVYNVLGEEVATLFDEEAIAGRSYSVKFDGSRLASGMYVVRLQYGTNQLVKKILLAK